MLRVSLPLKRFATRVAERFAPHEDPRSRWYPDGGLWGVEEEHPT
jgi:hypothetical protein